MRYPVKKPDTQQEIKMKQLSPKKRNKPTISESISFVIKGRLSQMKSMITREMKYKRTSTRGSKKEVEECKVEDKVQIGCDVKVESEVTAKKKGGKNAKVPNDEGPPKTGKRGQGRPKRKLSVEKGGETVKRGRKGKVEVKTEKVNLKRTTAKTLRDTSKTTTNIKNEKTIKKAKVSSKPKPQDKGKVKKAASKKREQEEVKEEPNPPPSDEKPPPETIIEEKVVKEENVKPEPKKKPGRKPNNKQKLLQYEPKTVLVKKRVIQKPNTKKKGKEVKKSKTNVSNDSKRHRVASLNALAKVHCLYENESRGAILDNLEAIKSETSSDNSSSRESEIPTRTLRSAPGLRAIGKHWDMDEGTFSSSDESSCDALVVTKPKITEVESDSNAANAGDGVSKKRRRNRTEIIMDLKDMVVRKRMASLNATAILAASYSMERRSLKSPKCEDTDEDSEDGAKKVKEKRKVEEPVKTEEDKSVIEVCATPNKKVSVIVNQDTDVTITGVYLNSTTRSTHHEGYCSIAGMQYRISATSHTQTAATAVATETILQPSGNGAGQDNVSRRRPIEGSRGASRIHCDVLRCFTGTLKISFLRICKTAFS